MWLRAKQLISSCPMLIINSWLPAMLRKPSPRERRIISSTTLGGNAFKDSLNRQLFWNQSSKCRIQVSEWRVSEKAFSKGGWGGAALDGWPPFYIATWKRSDSLNYMLIVSVRLAPTPPQLKQAIRPLAGQEGGRNARHFHHPKGPWYAKHGSADTAGQLKGVFTLVELNGSSPHGEPEWVIFVFLKCTL